MRKPAALLLAAAVTACFAAAANANPGPAPVGPAVTAPVTNDLSIAPAPPVAPAPAPATTTPATTGGLDWTAWLVLGIAALAGLETLLRGATALLGLVAPRTKNTVDDSVHDGLSHLRDEVAKLHDMLAGGAASPRSQRPKEAGYARLGVLASLAAASLAVGALVTQSGCASSQRESTIKAALVTTDATREAYLAYDASRQLQIVEAATSLDDGRAKLAEHRARRETVVAAITGVYRAIALAATLQDSQSLDALKRALEHAVSIVNLATGAGK